MADCCAEIRQRLGGIEQKLGNCCGGKNGKNDCDCNAINARLAALEGRINRLESGKNNNKDNKDSSLEARLKALENRVNQLIRELAPRLSESETAISRLADHSLILSESIKSINLIASNQKDINRYFAANFDSILNSEQ